MGTLRNSQKCFLLLHSCGKRRIYQQYIDKGTELHRFSITESRQALWHQMNYAVRCCPLLAGPFPWLITALAVEGGDFSSTEGWNNTERTAPYINTLYCNVQEGPSISVQRGKKRGWKTWGMQEKAGLAGHTEKSERSEHFMSVCVCKRSAVSRVNCEYSG